QPRTSEVTAALARLTRDVRPAVASAAVWAFRSHLAVEGSTTPNLDVIPPAVWRFGRHKHLGPMREALRDLIAHSNRPGEVRGAPVPILAGGLPKGEALALLTGLLRDGSDRVRRAASESLCECGPAAAGAADAVTTALLAETDYSAASAHTLTLKKLVTDP